MTATTEKLKVLFLCTGDSCRSQMAEAWTRVLKGDQVEAYSAGVEPHSVDPRAVHAMAEVGIDISGQTSKDVDTLEDIEFDYVITLCDNAHQACPVFPAKGKEWYDEKFIRRISRSPSSLCSSPSWSCSLSRANTLSRCLLT